MHNYGYLLVYSRCTCIQHVMHGYTSEIYSIYYSYWTGIVSYNYKTLTSRLKLYAWLRNFRLGRTKLIICFWSTPPSEIDLVTRLFTLNFSKLSLSINFTI